jgi:aminopeptidase N
LQAILKNGYSDLSHRAVAYDDVAQEMQEMQEKKIRPEHKLFWGAPQVVRIKWECMGATNIFKRDYPIDYIIVDSSKRRNRQCNSVLIVQVKRAMERAATEAEVDAGQISLFGTFSQSSNVSDGPPSPPPQRKSPRLKVHHQQQGTG